LDTSPESSILTQVFSGVVGRIVMCPTIQSLTNPPSSLQPYFATASQATTSISDSRVALLPCTASQRDESERLGSVTSAMRSSIDWVMGEGRRRRGGHASWSNLAICVHVGIHPSKCFRSWTAVSTKHLRPLTVTVCVGASSLISTWRVLIQRKIICVNREGAFKAFARFSAVCFTSCSCHCSTLASSLTLSVFCRLLLSSRKAA
jgi:hypothetical protein